MDRNLERLKEILEKIELTQTQRNRAVELYTNLCEAIEEKIELEIDFYPQGSFATKTAVRPYKNGKDQKYDVDVICEVQRDKNSINPEELKSIFTQALDNSRYSRDYEEHDKCFTVEYSEQDGVGFSIDLIPSIPEDYGTIMELAEVTDNQELVASSIAIPDTGELYKPKWITNNPRGFIQWFENAIQKYYIRYIVEYRDSGFYASIEDLPEEDVSNTLLNIIKILKRSRDVYYSRSNSENRPSSIIITTLVAKLVDYFPPITNEIELLKQVLTELNQLQTHSSKYFTRGKSETGDSISDIIYRENGEWIMNNPANGRDNLLNSWNNDAKKVTEFFLWINSIHKLLLDNPELREYKHIVQFYEAFAIDVPNLEGEKTQIIASNDSIKPWRY